MIHLQFPSAFPRPSYVPCEINVHAFAEDDAGNITACDSHHPDQCGFTVWVRGVNPSDAADFECIAVYERDFYARDCGGDTEASEQAMAYANQLSSQLSLPVYED